jgi:uncharacterized protein with PIN domain
MQFLVDKTLGKLAKWLRILGFDTIYLEYPALPEIREQVAQGRIFLTRNRRLLPNVPGAVFISSDHVDAQLGQLYREGHIDFKEELWFSRCILCNVPLTNVSNEEVDTLVPEYVRRTASLFARCPLCGKVYWPGSHLNRMKERIGLIKLQAAKSLPAP